MRNAPGVRGLNVPVVNKPGAGQTAAMTYLAQHRGSPNHLVLMSPSAVNS
jgi:tripartite-type tricarboxylate transporter receptor subunit TctC